MAHTYENNKNTLIINIEVFMKKIWFIGFIICFLFLSVQIHAISLEKAAKYVPQRGDVFFYMNYGSFKKFCRIHGINAREILNLDKNKSRFYKEFKRNNQYFKEFLIIGLSHKIGKKKNISSGSFALVKISPRYARRLKRKYRKMSSFKRMGYRFYLINKKRKEYAIFRSNIMILSSKSNLISYIRRMKRVRVRNFASLKWFIRNNKNQTIAFKIKLSGYLKRQLQGSVRKGEIFAKGLSSNVFVNALINLRSTTGRIKLDRRISIAGAMNAKSKKYVQRLLMINHFWIVGSSIGLSFIDMMARKDKKFKMSRSQVVMFQKVFGRIKTRKKRASVVMSVQLTNSETKIIVRNIKKQIKVAKEKLKQKRRINAMKRAIRSGNLGRVKRLINKVGNINKRDKFGNALLHEAAKYGKGRIILFLIKNGAFVNIRNRKGMTPLHMAAKYGKLSALKTLIKNGAYARSLDYTGKKAMDYIKKRGFKRLEKYLKKVK